MSASVLPVLRMVKRQNPDTPSNRTAGFAISLPASCSGLASLLPEVCAKPASGAPLLWSSPGARWLDPSPQAPSRSRTRTRAERPPTHTLEFEFNRSQRSWTGLRSPARPTSTPTAAYLERLPHSPHQVWNTTGSSAPSSAQGSAATHPQPAPVWPGPKPGSLPPGRGIPAPLHDLAPAAPLDPDD